MCIAICYVCVLPVSNDLVLYPTLAVMTAASWLVARKNARKWAREVHGGILLLLITGLMGITIGGLSNNPGWAQAGIVWVGGIIVWVSFGLGASSYLKPILTAIAIGILIVGTAVTLEVGSFLGFLPSIVPQWFSDLQDTFVNGDALSSGIKFYGLSTLAAGTPLMVALSFTPTNAHMPRRSLCIWAAAVGCIGAFVGGRRAILLVAILSPFLLVLWRRLILPRHNVRNPKWAPIAITFLVAGAAIAVAVFPGIASRVLALFADTAALASGGSPSAATDSVRIDQASRLLDAWSDRPVFGSGLGATLPDGFARSVERPWTFELQYHLLLFNVGLVGFVAVIAATLLIYIAIRRAVRDRPELSNTTCAIVTSCSALLIANATNPYLQAVGHGWPLGLVIGIAALAGNPSSDRASSDSTTPRPSSFVATTQDAPKEA